MQRAGRIPDKEEEIKELLEKIREQERRIEELEKRLRCSQTIAETRPDMFMIMSKEAR